MQDMSSVQWSRLAMQQQMLYYQNMQECLDLEEEIETLKTRIASKHKKHRRCDKEIEKENQVTIFLFSVPSAKRSTHRASLSNCTSN